MVTVAIAGGTGQVAGEVIDALMAAKKHDITILSRKEAPAEGSPPGTQWRTVDYSDMRGLVDALVGIDTLLSFVQTLADPGQESQRNLIDAAVAARVRRFAPSEHGSKGFEHMAWSSGKEKIREYLKQVNSSETVLEYTLFQPGLFLDYLAFPHRTARHLAPLQTVFDFAHRRAILPELVDDDDDHVDGNDAVFVTLTAVADFAAVVARAVDYQAGPWPVDGGIRGARLSLMQILELGERIRGRPFNVERMRLADLRAGRLEASWGLEARHPAVAADDEAARAMLRAVVVGFLLSSVEGAWDSSDEMNRLFPDYVFTPVEDFLAKFWDGQP
ncbi:NAD(P)-binding protein [Xylariaceae sp. FL0804]|nr:NAD(P)-binding protein [Xylariaceae sp. FL0804]